MTDLSDRLAKKRTGYADIRTVLTQDRVIAGWTKSGYAFLAASIGFAAVALNDDRDLPMTATSSILAAVALVVSVLVVSKIRNRHESAARKDNPSGFSYFFTSMLPPAGLAVGSLSILAIHLMG